MDSGILAHGGTGGAVAEIAFIVIPMAVFALLSRASRRRRERENAEARADSESTEAGVGADPPESAVT